MPTQHSVTEVRRRFASVIREVESGAHIEVTRYGEAVAVLVPCSEKNEPQTQLFWDAYLAFRQKHDLGEVGLSEEEFVEFTLSISRT